MKNKRGLGLSTNAIILIVLGVIVLVILAVGFTVGWSKFAPWLKPTNNVAEIVQACNLACNIDSVYDYCTLKRDLFDSEEKEVKNTNCYTLANGDGLSKYGVATCSVDCKSTTKCDDWKYTDEEGTEIDVKIIISGEDKTSDYCSS